MTTKIWKLINLLETTTEYFKKHEIENPRLNAERLLAHALDIDRIQLYLQFERLLTVSEVEIFRALVHRRSRHEPLQYITSETEFMGLPFQLTPDVLIPRPETELLVEHALSRLKAHQMDSPVIWDIGTGSGCIAVSLAHILPTCRVIASDISEEALKVAADNARLNHVDGHIQFLKHNILEDELYVKDDITLIICNPPYISENEWDTLPREVRLFEPAIALTDHQDGLTFYNRLFEIASHYPCNHFILELSGTQFDKINKLANNYNFKEIEMFADLNAIPRILEIMVK
jgi:release factor glutamine methyltransferase